MKLLCKVSLRVLNKTTKKLKKDSRIFKMGDTDLPFIKKGKSPENKVRTLYFQSQITILFDNELKKNITVREHQSSLSQQLRCFTMIA